MASKLIKAEQEGSQRLIKSSLLKMNCLHAVFMWYHGKCHAIVSAGGLFYSCKGMMDVGLLIWKINTNQIGVLIESFYNCVSVY